MYWVQVGNLASVTPVPMVTVRPPLSSTTTSDTWNGGRLNKPTPPPGRKYSETRPWSCLLGSEQHPARLRATSPHNGHPSPGKSKSPYVAMRLP